jgi:hypothetical protein
MHILALNFASFGTGGEIFSSPAIANDIVYIPGGDGKITALRASDGSVVWSCQTAAITWSSPAVVDGVLYVGSDTGVLYAFGESTAINTPTPTPIPVSPTSLPTNSSANTTQPTCQPSVLLTPQSINLTVSGNISSSQMTNLTITTNPAVDKITVSFTLTGQEGTIGFCNITLPKTVVPKATCPSIFIDNELAQNQGYTQDGYNYYVWFTTHFSTHKVSIEFSNEAYKGDAEGSISLIEILYGVVIALVIVIVVLVVLKLAIGSHKNKSLVVS